MCTCKYVYTSTYIYGGFRVVFSGEPYKTVLLRRTMDDSPEVRLKRHPTTHVYIHTHI